MKHVKTLNSSTLKESMKKRRLWRVPDFLSVSLQDILYGGQPELREQQ